MNRIENILIDKLNNVKYSIVNKCNFKNNNIEYGKKFLYQQIVTDFYINNTDINNDTIFTVLFELTDKIDKNLNGIFSNSEKAHFYHRLTTVLYKIEYIKQHIDYIDFVIRYIDILSYAMCLNDSNIYLIFCCDKYEKEYINIINCNTTNYLFSKIKGNIIYDIEIAKTNIYK